MKVIPKALRSKFGAVLITTLLFVVAMAIFAGSLLLITQSSHRERRASIDNVRSYYAAEASLHEALASLPGSAAACATSRCICSSRAAFSASATSQVQRCS